MKKQNPVRKGRNPINPSGLWSEEGLKNLDWGKIAEANFLSYHGKIEKAIAKAAKGKGWIANDRFREVFKVIGECAEELTASLLSELKKSDSEYEIDKLDTCWLSIFCMAMVSYCWSMAVARGKSVDRKRDKSGRKVWYEKWRTFPDMMQLVYEIGREIGTLKVFEEGDLDLMMQVRVLTRELTANYRKDRS